jgi:hypothetical protein
MRIARKFVAAWRRRSVRDAVAIVGLCFVTYIAAAAFDIFGQLYEFVKRYEAYELDEAIVVAVVFGFLMVIYSLRRVQDLKREILNVLSFATNATVKYIICRPKWSNLARHFFNS